MICDHARKLTIRSLGPWPEETLRHAYPQADIQLTTTPAGFGGVRKWFLCPRCDRRSGILYDEPVRGWACRICCNGRYASEVESRSDRLYRKVRKLRRRLGQTDPRILTVPFPGKPTGMHWSTYLRLRRDGMADEAKLVDLLRRNLPGPARIKILDRSIEMEADSEGDPLAEAWMYVQTFIPEE